MTVHDREIVSKIGVSFPMAVTAAAAGGGQRNSETQVGEASSKRHEALTTLSREVHSDALRRGRCNNVIHEVCCSTSASILVFPTLPLWSACLLSTLVSSHSHLLLILQASAKKNGFRVHSWEATTSTRTRMKGRRR